MNIKLIHAYHFFYPMLPFFDVFSLILFLGLVNVFLCSLDIYAPKCYNLQKEQQTRLPPFPYLESLSNNTALETFPLHCCATF